MVRCRIVITGAVQGVGFRPFVYRLATSLGLKGWVKNTPFGVEIEVEGKQDVLFSFISRLDKERPFLSQIYSMDVQMLPVKGYRSFEIVGSSSEGEVKIAVLPDIAVCDECLKEMWDPKDRRYLYPFINCTNCGPRYTIILSLPYDRKNTTMAKFAMCPQCYTEYTNPNNRRFHAQPNACPECGPTVWLEDKGGAKVYGYEAVRKCASLIKSGSVVAVKGLGGFHLMCLAMDDAVLQKLRERKRRYEKPFAVMFPDLDTLKDYCVLSNAEEQAVCGVERPILLLDGKGGLSWYVSCGLKTVGAFLPYTPLHHLLLAELKVPVVATSANVSDEPITYRNDEAREKLKGIADAFLMHDRDIARRCDDSVCFIASGRRILVRRARGFAPLPVVHKPNAGKTILALGPQIKNTIALATGDGVYVSQHIGDLDYPETRKFLKQTVDDFLRLFSTDPDVVVVDRHPGYYTSRYARTAFFSKKILRVQHHVAHVLSCAFEAQVPFPFIGVAFDGTGYGDDGTVWGGEIFLVSSKGYVRSFHLKPFWLAGYEKAVIEGWRVGLSLLMESEIPVPAWFPKSIDSKRVEIVRWMLERRKNAIKCTSVGRLFDGIASLCGIRDVSSFEAQAAVLLEHAADTTVSESYPMPVKDGVINYVPTVRSVVEDVNRGVEVSLISAKFHNALAQAILACARILRSENNTDRVVLSGGVFQNKFLLERIISLLESDGFSVYVNQLVPVNDGGISLGQVYAAILGSGFCV